MRPSVYIIGAGPGAPDLLTVRGLRALQSAHVVIYDRRVQPRLLDLAPVTAERIDVGSAAPQTAEQDAINFLIAEKAREGHVVARLKWGDPFLFDHGGPEALFLHEQRIAFEVVPGVPALVAAPAFAGIPLTYPGSGDTVTFVRGFEDDGRKAPEVDWGSVARLDGTLACFAGRHLLDQVVRALLAHGCPADETAAFITFGTLSAQQTVAAPLGELVSRVEESGVSAPGILIVGSVTGLRDHLRWFDNRPLFGRRVLVTRSREQAPELVELLELSGAEAVEAPVLRIEAPEDPEPIQQALGALASYDWLVFTSTNAVSGLLGPLLANARDVRALAGPRVCAVGPGTASRLHRVGVTADLQPSDHRARGVVAAMAGAGPLSGARILLPVSSGGGDSLGDELRGAGAAVTEVTAYRIITEEGDAHLGLYRQMLDRRIDAVTFTSANTVRAFVEIYGAEQSPDLLSATVVATIGPGAADAAERAGIRVDVATEGATVGVLVEALIRHFRP